MENKKKNILIVAAAFLLVLAVIFFFPKPLEKRLSAPLDENCVIYIDCREIVFNSGMPNEHKSYRVECTAENGLIDEAIELCTDTKTVSHPANLLPWKITKWDGYDIKIAIGRPNDSGEWFSLGEKEMIISREEFKIFRILNPDFSKKIVEFTKEYGTVDE